MRRVGHVPRREVARRAPGWSPHRGRVLAAGALWPRVLDPDDPDDDGGDCELAVGLRNERVIVLRATKVKGGGGSFEIFAAVRIASGKATIAAP